MEYRQYDFNFDRFTFRITETGLQILRKRFASGSETFIEFEEIGSKVIKERSAKILWLILSGLFLFFAVWVFVRRLNNHSVGDGAEIVHLCISAAFLLVYLVTRKNILYLAQTDNTGAIEFINRKVYRKSLEAFMAQLLEARNRYLLDKYSKVDDLLPYQQQYNNFFWLYNLKLLSREDLKQKIDELDHSEAAKNKSMPADSGRTIGFKAAFHDEENDPG